MHVVLDKCETRMALVLGCQRSGTTMLIELLGRSSFIFSYGEMDAPIMDRKCRIADNDQIEKTLRKSPAHVVAVKPICDSQWANRLLNDFANSKIIWLYRDFNDTINSSHKKFSGQLNRMEWFSNSEWDRLGWRVENIKKDHPVIRLLQELFHVGATREDAVGLMWALRTGLFFEEKLNSNKRVMLMKYESLVTKPGKHVSDVCRFLNIEFENKLVADVRASSISKNPAPVLHPKVRKLCEELQDRLDTHWNQSQNCEQND